MVTYVNDLRLSELATGEGSGTWGTTTNTNLELIGEALGYGTEQSFSSDADATTTIGDGVSDPARAMYFKVTSAGNLTATRTLTIAPNTVSRVMFIENATSGSQSIAISQGSGANVTIATGKTAVVYLDGAGSGAAVVDAMALVDPGVTDTLAEVLTAGNTTTTDQKIQFRDSAIYINSSADGQLDLVADTEVQIATTTVDLNGALDVSGAITGTTATLTTADNSTQLTLISTDADANAGPKLKLRRDSASPADDDLIGAIDWTSENSSGDEHDFLNLTARMRDVTAGSEDVAFAWTAYLNGTGREIQSFVNTDAGAAQMVFNEDSQDIDFRVESNGNTHALFVDGGNEAVLVGKSTTALATAGLAFGTAGFASLTRDGAEPLNINRLSDDGKLAVFYKDGTEIGSLFTNGGAFVMKGNSASAPIQIQTVDGNEDIEVDPDGFIKMETAGSERLRINVNGSVGIGVADGDVTSDGNAARTYVGIIGTANRGRLNLGTTASNGADAGTLSFTNGANTLADISVDTTAGVQNTGTMYVNGTRSIKIQAAASDEVIFNEGSSDTDFRVESNGNANIFVVDANTDKVGVGRSGPQSIFEVHTATDKNIGFSDQQTEVGNVPAMVAYQDTGSLTDLGMRGVTVRFATSTQERLRLTESEAVFNDGSHNNDFRVESDGNANMLFVDASENRVGIGLTPRATLDVYQQSNRTSKTGTTRGVLHLQDGDTPANNEITAITFESNSNNAASIIGQSLTNSGSHLFFGTSNSYGSGVTNTALTINQGGVSTFDVGANFNESGADSDFRVESDGNANMLFVDAGNDRIGIANGSPGYPLDVTGVIQSGDQISVSGSRNFALNYSNGNIATIGGYYGSGGLILGYGVWPKSGSGAFVSSSSLALSRQAIHLNGYDFDMYSGTNQTVAADSDVSLDLHAKLSGIAGYVFNEASADIDFRVESNNDAHCLYVDAGNDRVIVGASASTAGTDFVSFDANPGGTGQLIQCGRDSTSTKNQVIFTNPNGTVGSIQTAGSATAYNTSSDARLKENIADADDAGELIDAIQVRQFDWIADGEHQRYGMVAQELNTVAPEAVSEGETEEDMMGVDYSKLVPMLIKEIQSLRARVADLES